MRCWKGAGQGVCGFPTKGVGGHVTCGALSQRRDQDPRGKAQTRWWCGPLTPVGHVLSLRLMPARPRGFVPGLQSRAPLPRTSGCRAGGVWRRRPRYHCSAAARPPSPLLSPESRPLACSPGQRRGWVRGCSSPWRREAPLPSCAAPRGAPSPRPRLAFRSQVLRLLSPLCPIRGSDRRAPSHGARPATPPRRGRTRGLGVIPQITAPSSRIASRRCTAQPAAAHQPLGRKALPQVTFVATRKRHIFLAGVFAEQVFMFVSLVVFSFWNAPARCCVMKSCCQIKSVMNWNRGTLCWFHGTFFPRPLQNVLV